MTRLPHDVTSRSSGRFAAIRMTSSIVFTLAIACAALACGESTLAPLPLDITVAASRTTAAPGDTIAFVATVQGGSLLGLNVDYGDSSTDLYGTSGARTGKVTFRHAYTARGTFTAKITLTDATLGTKSASVDIHVN
jgi:hypothetical protein